MRAATAAAAGYPNRPARRAAPATACRSGRALRSRADRPARPCARRCPESHRVRRRPARGPASWRFGPAVRRGHGPVPGPVHGPRRGGGVAFCPRVCVMLLSVYRSPEGGAPASRVGTVRRPAAVSASDMPSSAGSAGGGKRTNRPIRCTIYNRAAPRRGRRCHCPCRAGLRQRRMAGRCGRTRARHAVCYRSRDSVTASDGRSPAASRNREI